MLAIFSSLGISFSFNKLNASFDDHCILDASVEFEQKLPTPSINETQDNSTVVAKRNFAALSEVFNETYAKYLEQDESKEYPIEQTLFLSDRKSTVEMNRKFSQTFLRSDVIDEHYTVWGNKVKCDFGIYIPVFQSIFGIIMATMFVICGKGGKSDPQSFLPQPWRIVSPALIFFLIMTIISIVELVFIEGGMGEFCEQFGSHLSDMSCMIALNHFKLAPVKGMQVSPGVLIRLVSSFNYIAFSCWFISMLVLLARVLFVIDFQLVRVTVKTIEFEKGDEKTSFQAVEVEHSGNEEERKLATTKC